MPYPWEEMGYEDVRDSIESVVLTNVSSGWNTLVSGAVSGETKYIVNVEVETSTPLSSPIVYVRELDGESTARTLNRIQLTGSSSIVNQIRRKWGGDDIRSPVYMLDGDSRIDVRADQSGLTTVTGLFFTER